MNKTAKELIGAWIFMATATAAGFLLAAYLYGVLA